MDNSINQGQIWLGLFVGLICPPHYPYLYIMLHFLGHFCFRAQDHGFTHQMKELRRRAKELRQTSFEFVVCALLLILNCIHH